MRFKGIEYPLTKHPQGFFHNARTDLAQIKSDMASIILTEPGERIMEPRFGCALNAVNLNAPYEIAQSEARVKIATALKKWEKRVQVTDIKADFFESEEHNVLLIKIQVFFIDPINIGNVESLVVHKSLGGLDGRRMPF